MFIDFKLWLDSIIPHLNWAHSKGKYLYLLFRFSFKSTNNDLIITINGKRLIEIFAKNKQRVYAYGKKKVMPLIGLQFPFKFYSRFSFVKIVTAFYVNFYDYNVRT